MSESAQGIPGLPDLTHPTELIQFGTHLLKALLLYQIRLYRNYFSFLSLCVTPGATTGGTPATHWLPSCSTGSATHWLLCASAVF